MRKLLFLCFVCFSTATHYEVDERPFRIGTAETSSKYLLPTLNDLALKLSFKAVSLRCPFPTKVIHPGIPFKTSFDGDFVEFQVHRINFDKYIEFTLRRPVLNWLAHGKRQKLMWAHFASTKKFYKHVLDSDFYLKLSQVHSIWLKFINEKLSGGENLLNEGDILKMAIKRFSRILNVKISKKESLVRQMLHIIQEKRRFKSQSEALEAFFGKLLFPFDSLNGDECSIISVQFLIEKFEEICFLSKSNKEWTIKKKKKFNTHAVDFINVGTLCERSGLIFKGLGCCYENVDFYEGHLMKISAGQFSIMFEEKSKNSHGQQIFLAGVFLNLIEDSLDILRIESTQNNFCRDLDNARFSMHRTELNQYIFERYSPIFTEGDGQSKLKFALNNFPVHSTFNRPLFANRQSSLYFPEESLKLSIYNKTVLKSYCRFCYWMVLRKMIEMNLDDIAQKSILEKIISIEGVREFSKWKDVEFVNFFVSDEIDLLEEQLDGDYGMNERDKVSSKAEVSPYILMR